MRENFRVFFSSLSKQKAKRRRRMKGKIVSLLIIHQKPFKMCGMLQLWNHTRHVSLSHIVCENPWRRIWRRRWWKKKLTGIWKIYPQQWAVVIKIHFWLRLHISHDIRLLSSPCFSSSLFCYPWFVCGWNIARWSFSYQHEIKYSAAFPLSS